MPSEMHSTDTERDLLVEDHPWDAPWPEPWRELYERIVPLAWPLVVRPLAAYGVDRRAYLPREVERRLRPVAEHLAYAVIPLADQEAFLNATSELWGVPSAEPAHASDQGHNQRHADAASPVLEGETRERFAAMLASVLIAAFHCQTAYDLALGMRRRLQRHPLELRNGARWWARHLAARRAPRHQGLS
jgi:hypothetical protein